VPTGPAGSPAWTVLAQKERARQLSQAYTPSMSMKRDTQSGKFARLHVLDALRATAEGVRADATHSKEAARRTIADARALRDRVARDRRKRLGKKKR
jgi:hypothetical protein